ncbi:hypothetical protein HHK36_027534 [Tetracentron sinense]|uniref:Uncharacterized protein n=1 Tax=Tetracentron sinense TaxID=13715 RepID=A0A834YI02_TETSI|nr:hypothetical protein HHK36_027534 [Tetracentron sinense]
MSEIDRFGHFKIWHGAGSVLVAVSFSSVFGGCPPCKIFGTNSTTMQTVGYSMFAAIFNVGWAAIQVSHMSMVNCITRNSTSRVVLASCLNAFIMYHWIAYLSIFIGCCFVTIFLIGTKEPRLKQGMQGKNHQRISWAHWFKKVLYYQVALVYVLTGLVTNVSQEITWTSQRLKAFYTAGGILWIFFGAGILFLPSSMHNLMYLLSITIGVANALMVVFVLKTVIRGTGVSMQSVLVGEDLHGCAFVYGSLSFLDKISCGLLCTFLSPIKVSHLGSPWKNQTVDGKNHLYRLLLGHSPFIFDN